MRLDLLAHSLHSRTHSAQDVLALVKCHEPIKIRLPDDTTKTMLISRLDTVVEAMGKIAEKLEIKNYEEYVDARG